MSTPTIILLLTSTGLSAHLASRKASQPLLTLADGDWTALRTLLQAWKHATFHLLTDLAEEDFQYESVPHLAAADRRALFARKLDQIYRLTPYRRIVIQEKGRRGGQDKLMLSALTVREVVDRLVELLLEEKCALAGIHSVALATDELLRRLTLDLPHLLLIGSVESGSLRQNYFLANELRFSRLSVSQSEDDPQRHAAEIAAETRRARQYLTTLRLMDREMPLDVVLLINGDKPPQLVDALLSEFQQDAPQISAGIESVADISVRLGLPASCGDWRTLLCIAIARGMIRDHYRPPAAGRYHLLRRMGRALGVTAAAMALGGALMGWQGLAEAVRQQDSIDRLNRALRTEIARKQDLDRQIKALTDEQPQAMKEAVELEQKYLARWPDVDSNLQRISQVLARFPLLRITRVSWQARPDATPPAEGNAPVAQEASTVASDGRRWQFIALSGDIPEFSANHREGLHQIERLIAELGKLPQTTATLSKTPLDIRPQGTVTQQENLDQDKSDFTLRIVIAPPEGNPS